MCMLLVVGGMLLRLNGKGLDMEVVKEEPQTPYNENLEDDFDDDPDQTLAGVSLWTHY